MPTDSTVNHCERFRSWARVEPRARTTDFAPVLRAEIADPLWMLTRQWQFGEFQGDDGGSPVFAKVKVQTSPVIAVKPGNHPSVPYNNDYPLEQWAESEPVPFDLRASVRAGRKWADILEKKLTERGLLHAYAAHLQAHEHLFGFKEIPAPNLSVDAANLAMQLRLHNNKRLIQFASLLPGRGIDGLRLYAALEFNWAATVDALVIQPALRSVVEAVVTAFVHWYERKFDNAPARASAWDANRLEYRLMIKTSGEAGQNTTLCAGEYSTGQLDWYHFDVTPPDEAPADLQQMAPVLDVVHETKIVTVIPSPARYAGMPNKRWWEFEDSTVDLGNINADTTDIAKILLVEFALMYGNDWFIIPFDLPVGTLSRVEAVIVTDVFGVRTAVKSGIQGQTDDWTSWGMYNLSPYQKDFAQPMRVAPDTRLFLPPTTVRTMNGNPLEQVIFVRDEMSNTVWAIEKSLSDHLGKALDAHAAAVALRKQMDDMETSLIDHVNLPQAPASEETQTSLRWVLGTSVPENWIPFVPKQLPDDIRSIRLQRGSMIRQFKNETMRVRPQSAILRHGFGSSQNPLFFVANSADKPLPYFLHEEEVPRTGIRVVGRIQRTRWYNGRVLSWYGLEKTNGRGEGSSGLSFDTLSITTNKGL